MEIHRKSNSNQDITILIVRRRELLKLDFGKALPEGNEGEKKTCSRKNPIAFPRN